MEDKKKVLIGILSVLVCIMAVGYALLAQELTINGSASIDSTWRVEITNISSKDVVGDAVNKVDPSYTATTANFSVGFTQPGDSITYDITVTNKGTLDAVVESITVNKGDNPAITYTTSGLKRGDKIAKNNGTNTLTVKVDYDSSVTSQPVSTTNDITVNINYQQDLGQVPAYEGYSIGDTIEFAGSNWKVIKASTGNEDYVTLMKEKVLTHAELGNNYAVSYKCTSISVTYHYYDCTRVNQVIELDTMAYYWSNTCHYDYIYGTNEYTNEAYSCGGHNDYNTTKIKEMLEQQYLPTLGESNLKEVDGYKIRLITLDELQHLGCTSSGCASSWGASENVPSWIYENYGEDQTGVGNYWTMTADNSNSLAVIAVCAGCGGQVTRDTVRSPAIGVRPVINLLKSSIE